MRGPIYGLSNIGNNQDDFQAYNGNGLTDTVSFSHGRHFLKAGIDFRRNYTNDRPHGNPSFTFNALETAIPNEAVSGVNTGYSLASFLLGTSTAPACRSRSAWAKFTDITALSSRMISK